MPAVIFDNNVGNLMQPVLAGVLQARGTRAFVVRGSDGIDEITTTGPSSGFETGGGTIAPLAISPQDLGLAAAEPGDLAGGDPERNAAVTRSVLSGDKGPARDIVVLNSAAALTVAGIAGDLGEGLGRAAESIDSGRAAGVLSRWVEASNRAARYPSACEREGADGTHRRPLRAGSGHRVQEGARAGGQARQEGAPRADRRSAAESEEAGSTAGAPSASEFNRGHRR